MRGATRTHKVDSIYRAAARGESTHSRARAQAVVDESFSGSVQPEPSKAKLTATREQVEQGWIATSHMLRAQGWPELAAPSTSLWRRDAARAHREGAARGSAIGAAAPGAQSRSCLARADVELSLC